MAFTEFPSAVQTLLQQGFLVRELEEGLDSSLAYRMLAIPETFPGGIGETMTRTRKGRKAPITTPMVTNSNVATSLDNGLPNTGAFSTERYVATLKSYADTVDLNLMQSEAQIASDFIANARNNAVQASQSMDRICRNKLFDRYMGGNTRVITVPATNILAPDGTANAAVLTTATGTVNVDDIRGFTELIVAGEIVAVSGTNTIAAVINNGTTLFPVRVTAAAAYTYEAGKGIVDVTNTPLAIPGTLTFINDAAGTYTPAAGDTIKANNAPSILRSGGHRSTHLLTSSNFMTLGILLDAVTVLRNNGVPPKADGTYHVVLNHTSMRQLFDDSVFQNLYTGSQASGPYKNAVMVPMLGLTFITTNETLMQVTPFPNGSTANTIHRVIISGDESLIQCNFEGMETWLANKGLEPIAGVAMVDGVVQIIRPPLDRLQQFCAMTWEWIGDFAVPTDVTATPTIIPTATLAAYKRCVVVEHAA